MVGGAPYSRRLHDGLSAGAGTAKLLATFVVDTSDRQIVIPDK
jgi:hypothetical protein